MFRQFIDILKKAIESQQIKEPHTPKKRPGDNSVERRIYNDMGEYFERIVTERSLGERMIYHMGYMIWLSEEEYSVVDQEMNAILPEVINLFYKIIEKHRAQFPKITPPSLDWSIQIVNVKDLILRDKEGKYHEITTLEKGKTRISSTFYAEKLNKGSDNDSEVVLSFNPVNSDVNKNINVNYEMLLEIERVGADAYTKRFDMRMLGDTDSESDSTADEDFHSLHGYGILTYHLGTSGKRKYTIKDNNFFISGPEDKRQASNVICLPNTDIALGHLFFKYNADEDLFYVCAYGDTVLNGRELEESTRDNPKPYRVARKSKFLLSSNVSLEFEQFKIEKGE